MLSPSWSLVQLTYNIMNIPEPMRKRLARERNRERERERDWLASNILSIIRNIMRMFDILDTPSRNTQDESMYTSSSSKEPGASSGSLPKKAVIVPITLVTTAATSIKTIATRLDTIMFDQHLDMDKLGPDDIYTRFKQIRYLAPSILDEHNYNDINIIISVCNDMCDDLKELRQARLSDYTRWEELHKQYKELENKLAAIKGAIS